MGGLLSTARKILPWLLFAFGGITALGTLGNATERGWLPSDVATWWVFGVLPISAGLVVFGWSAFANLQRRQADLEDAVIEAALANGGIVTAADLVNATQYTLGQAQAVLSYLSRKGYVSPSLTDDGVLVYSLSTSTRPAGPLPGRKPRRPRPRPAGLYVLSSVQIAWLQRALIVSLAILFLLLYGFSLLITWAGAEIWPVPD